MDYIDIKTNYDDLSEKPFEVVERKGVGHPDSLADALANEVSIAYSRYCLNHFGLIPHHNVDKLYIGAGHYKNNYGSVDMHAPVVIRINGRMSKRFGNTAIPVEEIQEAAVRNYLHKVLPGFNSSDFIVESNATQNTKVPYWFSPRNAQDIPDSTRPHANDTSVCVSHWKPTLTESLAYRLERYFWSDVGGFAIPRFKEIGQDIKVMVVRRDRFIEATLCVPTISLFTESYEHYKDIIKRYEVDLQDVANNLLGKSSLSALVKINPYQKQYMLGKGSCIECGEEGVVGRGNNINGIISSHRIHTLESWAGKNPVYHTGRVYGYMTSKLSRLVSEEFSVNCTITAVTRCGDSLFPPYQLMVSLNKPVDVIEVKRFIANLIMETDYIEEILSFKPWMIKL